MLPEPWHLDGYVDGKQSPGDTFGAWAVCDEDIEPQSIPNTEDTQPQSSDTAEDAGPQTTDNAEDAEPQTNDKESDVTHEGNLLGFVSPRTIVQYIDALNVKSTRRLLIA